MSTLNVWDVDRGEAILTVGGPAPFSAAALSADGKRAVSGYGDQTLRLWDLERGEVFRTLTTVDNLNAAALSVDQKDSMYTPGSVALSADGKIAMFGLSGGDVVMYDVESADEGGYGRHNDGVRAVALSASGKLGVSGSDDGTVNVWDWQMKSLPIARFCADAAILACCLAEGARLVCVGDSAGRVHFLRLRGNPTASITPRP